MDALAHLFRMPTLTEVTFMLGDTLPNQSVHSDSPLFSLNLHALTLYSKFLEPISRFISRTRLPALTDFGAYIDNCPSKQDACCSVRFLLPSTHEVDGRRSSSTRRDLWFTSTSLILLSKLNLCWPSLISLLISALSLTFPSVHGLVSHCQ